MRTQAWNGRIGISDMLVWLFGLEKPVIRFPLTQPSELPPPGVTISPAAVHTARELLESYLSGKQLRELSSQGWFTVPSPKFPDRIYRISIGRRLVLIEPGKTEELCIYDKNREIPFEDVALMFKLRLATRAGEEEILKKAGHYTLV